MCMDIGTPMSTHGAYACGGALFSSTETSGWTRGVAKATAKNAKSMARSIRECTEYRLPEWDNHWGL